MIKLPSLKEMMEAGAHFGHKKERSYPKARQYIYVLKDQIYIIDLEKTRDMLEETLAYISKAVSQGKNILFVGTKRQAQAIVEKIAKEVGSPYINHRWLGGTLTNFATIRKNLKHLEELEDRLKTSDIDQLTKREKARLQEEADKLHIIFDGIRHLENLPDILFIVDTAKERIAVAEAKKMGLAVAGIADTNANPELVDYPIVANDDALKTIEMILSLVAQAIKEGQAKQKMTAKANVG